MADKIAELRKDIEEIQALTEQATRQKIKDILSIESRKLITELTKFEELHKAAEQLNLAAKSSTVATADRCYEVKLTNYAWDQTNKFVKFYVTLPNVNSIDATNINCTFTNKSLELQVKNLDKKNYVFTINKLLHDINMEESFWKTKTDMVIISVAKCDTVHWTHVTELEKKASESKHKLPETDKGQDPSEGLMSIMRNMYEQGDDEMKRTIAKAWTESQQKGPAF